MEFTLKRNARFITLLLLATVVTQIAYTTFYTSGITGPLILIWALEAIIFGVLAAFAGAAMAQAKSFHLGWSAIAFSAILNFVQVSIGLTLFGPFREAAKQVEGIGLLIGAVVAFAFMVYYAANILLGFAALVFGMAKINAGGRTLGVLTAMAGAGGMAGNAILVIFGRDGFLPSAVAGASGLIATLLLALCVVSIVSAD